MKAAELGFDLVGTTLSGYTATTRGRALPDFELVEKLVQNLSVPVISEGGISTPEELEKMYDLGVFSAVVGSAITRPLEITQRFMKAVKA
ncbi:putative N-acetylmannosamine-6-phosphate 2-epimerase [compost metagenome]